MPPQIKQAKLETLEAIIKEVEGKRQRMPRDPWKNDNHPDPADASNHARVEGYNDALSDLLTTLQASLTLMKNER